MTTMPAGAAGNKLGEWWQNIKRVFRILGVARISIIMVGFSWFTLFHVGQVKDAIVALGNFASPIQFVIFGLVGLLWALMIWYWARVFCYIEYHKVPDLRNYEFEIIKHTPRILGVAALLIIAISFLKQAPLCQIKDQPNPIRIIGLTLIGMAIVFLLLVYLRRKIFQLDSLPDVHTALQEINGLVSMEKLPRLTQKILYSSTTIVIILLIALIIFPIQLTIILGDGVTTLLICLAIWLPILYWVRYFSLKLRFPLFLVLFIVMAVFSLFNGNKNIRFTDTPHRPRINLSDFYQQWNQRVPVPKAVSGKTDQRKPLIIVISEGGGIRAAYWSAKLLARIQSEYPKFRDDLFGISSVSGGSFGATIFAGLLKWNVHGQPPAKNELETKTAQIIGKDYLSPVIACMLTREVVQLLCPVPIASFDHAKVFENTWEYHWQKVMNDETFGAPFLSLWANHSGKAVPPLFINTTHVEDGNPVIISPLDLNFSSGSNPVQMLELAQVGQESNFKDFYDDINNTANDVSISTASLLSARFPYVGPAGTIRENNGKTIGLVDGGYFENTGANTAYQILLSLKTWDEKQRSLSDQEKSNSPARQEELSIYRSKIKPIILYIKNGVETDDVQTSGKTMFYQLFAPIQTLLQVRDSHTKNALFRLKEFVELYQGEFITYSLKATDYEPIEIPLGWALSKKAQEQIDQKVDTTDITNLKQYLAN